MAGPFLLLYPAGLLALLAIVSPVLIHLFSRSRGRRVLIGHIDLVRKARRRQVLEVRMTQWLLLALRILIVILAAGMLAGLATSTAQPLEARAVYVTPGWLEAASAAERAALPESARLLDRGVPLLDTMAVSRDPSVSSANPGAVLAEQLIAKPHEGGVQVHALGRADAFDVRLTDWPVDIQWTLKAPRAPAPLPPYNVVILHASDRLADAQRFEAALDALQTTRWPALRWQRLLAATPEAASDAAVDAVIALDADAHALLGPDVTVITDATGPGQQVDTTVAMASWPLTRFFQAQSPTTPPPGRSWRDANGLPVFWERRVDGARILTLAGRFQPGWNDLLDQPDFPQWLLTLLAGPEEQRLLHGHAPVNPQDLAGPPVGTAPPLVGHSLASWLALALALTWLLERAVAESRWNRHD